MVIPKVVSAENEPKPQEPQSEKASLRMLAPKASERIEYLASLESDWDGYGSLPITDAAIQVATRLLLQVHQLTNGELRLPFITPLPEGGLELEWIRDSGKELNLIISADGREIEYLLDFPSTGGGVDESEGKLNEDIQLSALIASLD